LLTEVSSGEYLLAEKSLLAMAALEISAAVTAIDTFVFTTSFLVNNLP